MSLSHRATQLLESMSLGLTSLITAGIITDSDASPYTVTLDNITGFSCLNTSSANAITFTFTFSDTSTMVVPILAEGSYSGAFEKTITTIAYAGTTPSFTAELMRRHV